MVYCPTGDMTADLLTKPLQGSQFKRFRDAILNVQENASRPPPKLGVTMMHRSVLRKEQKEPNVQEKEPSGHRTKGMRVRWKRPLCEIFYYGKYVRRMRGSKQQMLLQLQQSQPLKHMYRKQYRNNLRLCTRSARRLV